jgi:6-phosphogluconolactonase/glucosamine-6-phosphate isomerase/deaminase
VIPFYPVLAEKRTREKTAEAYERDIAEVMAHYQKRIALLGIGLDGHTAGLPVGNAKFKLQNSKVYGEYLVVDYKDSSGIYGERVTMTFAALAHLDLLIVLVFGADKQKALELVFSEGTDADIPGRFYKRPDIAKKTLFITDQKV